MRRWRPSALIGVVLVGLAVALLAAWQLQSWRDHEHEARLRGIHTTDGTMDVRTDFRSSILGATRRVWVYLPLEYRTEPDRRFPVLYMQDGQNVFDGATADVAGREWRVDETLERLSAERRIAPLIVVAVDSGDAGERRTDFTPTRDESAPTGGGADAYGRMLLEELKPWIDHSYRTQPGREATGIAGSALGGLFSLYWGLKHAETFSQIASLSTAVWWDERFIVRFVDGLPSKPETVVWVDVGTAEGRRSVEWAQLLRDALIRKGWKEGVDLRYVEVEGGRCDERAWATRMPEILSFFYPRKPAPRASTSPPTPPSLTSSPIPPSAH